MDGMDGLRRTVLFCIWACIVGCIVVTSVGIHALFEYYILGDEHHFNAGVFFGLQGLMFWGTAGWLYFGIPILRGPLPPKPRKRIPFREDPKVNAGFLIVAENPTHECGEEAVRGDRFFIIHHNPFSYSRELENRFEIRNFPYCLLRVANCLSPLLRSCTGRSSVLTTSGCKDI